MSIRIRLSLVLFVALALGAAATPAAATADGDPPDLTAFEGRFAHAGGARDRRGLEAAVDRVVARMGLFLQAIARPRILEALRPAPRLAVEVVGPSRVRITLGRWRSPAMPVDGTERTVTGPDGSSTRFSVRHHAGRLYTRARTAQGTRESWMTLGPNGRRLTMQVRVRAERLPAPIEYALRFARR